MAAERASSMKLRGLSPGALAAARVPRESALRPFVESRAFNAFITLTIVVNAITLGLETSERAMANAGAMLTWVDKTALLIFSGEMLLKIGVYRRRFFTRGWNLFDLGVVAIAWLPSAGPLSVLRALRVLRVLRLVSIVPQMRVVVGALLNALPGMGSIVAVLLLVFYVAAVMATKLFGAQFPEWFGDVGASMYTLFQIMTLESWSMGIVRPVMTVYPLAWTFFVPFVIVTSFAVLNLFIALIVNSMQSVHQQDREAAVAMEDAAHGERQLLLEEISELRRELRQIAGARGHVDPDP